MRLDNCCEDLSLISRVIACVTLDASQYLNKPSGHVHSVGHRLPRPGAPVKQVAKLSGFFEREAREQPHIDSLPGRQPDRDEIQKFHHYAEKLHQMMVSHVRLTHQISDYSAQQIRGCVGRDQYPQLQNIDLMIRVLEGLVSNILRDQYRPHTRFVNLAKAITEYRVALSDLLMILDQAFVEREVVESRTECVDQDIFAGFSFH
ncbi:hypothetical protein NVR66_14700 [Enterobacter bugandensis]|uniref:hypothetical protein n=1 Tax=Enterobacter bugandensis TaxID=881260 RepID=UPI0023B105AD|nr:hypothetical protein [Enterobacter bugandensis]MDE7590878.1 hypothetical protein [Enterobacter bugandensis]